MRNTTGMAPYKVAIAFFGKERLNCLHEVIIAAAHHFIAHYPLGGYHYLYFIQFHLKQ